MVSSDNVRSAGEQIIGKTRADAASVHQANHMGDLTATSTPPGNERSEPMLKRVCPVCAREMDPEFAFCPMCGASLGETVRVADLEQTATVTGPSRRRIGGTAWTQQADIADRNDPEDNTNEVLRPSISESITARPRKKRRRRRWYRRPVILVPLTALLVFATGLGVLGYQAGSTVATLHRVSTPPPTVVDNTLGAEPIPTDVVIDSGPAQEAVRAAASQGEQGDEDDGGLFGKVRDAASDAGDLADGAAVASGMKDPSTEALTILVMGVDARPGSPIDVAVRPDALMVLRLNPTTGSCRMLAIPRDTRTELPGYGQTKVNHALLVGGVPYQQLVVERMLGIAIDRYAVIDFVGFRELVEAVGGVPVTVPTDIVENGQVLFAAGPQSFDGEQALAYARYRGGADVDVGRVRRQQQIIRGLVAVAGGRDAVRDVNDLLPAVEQHVRTDLSPAEMVAIADRFRTRCTDQAIELDALQGDIVPSTEADPILKRPQDYNVVDPATIQEKVAALMQP